MMQKRIFSQIIGAILGAISICIISFFVVKSIQNMSININLGGDKAAIFGFLFLGIPFGIRIGLFIVDKIFFKLNASFLGLVLSIVLCFIIGGFGGVIILSLLGNFGIFIIPILFFASSFFGYYLPKKSRTGPDASVR